ncbi:monosaccharide ABC transporter membrane protein (CUT2 family) [Dongia mobilis]|uniref:Monosaccharide ABC transporter membrane protein (CUT2 family) n=1 Tax=Dongia mobilis TaxID=578943 RepID=A0A4R6WS64_9PROT|nr:ABC transporter permease [Dongia mobilis]TDQ82321.1 monosaccharide ABC transporter membrane protein (CUT2 family) [Dongia mobilis]
MTRHLKAAAPQLAALFLVLLANWIVFPEFFHIRVQDGRLYGSLVDVFNRGAPVALLAIGMTLVIATRGIDLSVGAVMAIAGATAATLVNDGHGAMTAIAAALAVGLLCGLWNGILVALLDIQPIIATLILMVAGRGIAQLITEGQIVTFVDPALIFMGSGAIAGIPMPVILAFLALCVTLFLYRRTALGLLTEAIGINRRASAYAGVNARAVLLVAYAWCGLTASLAGIIAAADIKGADANNAGLWLELDAILAVVIGGTSLFGGRFRLVLSFVGALIIQAMNTGILLSGFKPEFNLIVKAFVILVLLLMQSGASGALLDRLALIRSRPRLAPEGKEVS